ncbi:TPA: dihydrodipicolinate synthase family protein, partial [Streptococcus pneumoniae]
GGTYGAMPELFLKLNQLIADKDLETARELQYAINAIIGKLTSAHGNMYGVIKEVLKINEGLTIGSVRSPLTPVTEEDRPVVEAAAALKEALVPSLAENTRLEFAHHQNTAGMLGAYYHFKIK